MLIVPFAFRRVFPLFGILLVGWLGVIVSIVFAAVWLYAAWALYRLDRRGWWVFLVAMVILSISTLITYSRHDPMEIYRIAGYSEAQLAQIQQMNVFTRASVSWLSLIGTVPLLLYLLYIRRFFRATSALPSEMISSR